MAVLPRALRVLRIREQKPLQKGRRQEDGERPAWKAERPKGGITLLFLRKIFFLAAAVLIVIRILTGIGIYQENVRRIPDEQQIAVTGTLLEKTETASGFRYLTGWIRLGGVRLKGDVRIAVYVKEDTVITGSRIAVSGTAYRFSHAPNEGNFDAADYYLSQNICASLNADSVRVIQQPVPAVGEWISVLRTRMAAVTGQHLPEGEAGILTAMTTGNRALLGDEERQAYTNHGIAHILAVSGLHVSVVGMGVYRLLRRRLYLGYPLSVGVSGAVILLFCVLSGSSVSTVRAVCMFLAFLGAELGGRTNSMWNSAAWAMVFVLLLRPLSVFSAAFWLSFGAVGTILFFVPVLSVLIPERFAFGIGIWAGMLPLTAYYYYQIPVWSVLLNFVILPLCPFLLGFGLAGGLTGLILPGVSGLLFLPCHLILLLYRLLMQVTDFLPGGIWITGKPPTGFIILFYGVLYAGCLLYQKRGEGLCGAAAALAAMVLVFAVPAPSRLEITMLDVGQGDGLYLSSSDGTSLMIDGGSSSVKAVGQNRILPFLKCRKVRKIDLWLVSHTDEDHISGLIEVLDAGFPVDTLVLSQATPADGQRRRLEESASANHTRIRFVKTGSSIRTRDFSMDCLAPDADRMEDTDDKNEMSQVWLLRGEKFSMLFTGDAGRETEERLLKNDSLQDVMVLKAGHHGSAGATTEEFLEKVRPEYTLISAGKKNRYGHPSQEMLGRLKQYASRAFVTKDVGQITLYEGENGVMLTCPGSR